MITLREVSDGSRAWVRSVVGAEWGSTKVVTPGRVYDDVSALPGFLAESDGTPIALALWDLRADECELVVLQSVHERVGGGSAVTQAVVDVGRARGCRRCVVYTTNDNVHAIRFYQRRGWDLVTVHRNAMDEVRRIKPEVSLTGDDDIPLRHMLELEIVY